MKAAAAASLRGPLQSEVQVRLLSGIRGRLIVSFSALVLVIAAFVFVFFPARLERQALRAVESKAAVVRDITAYALGPALADGNPEAIHRALAGAARDYEVRQLLVRDLNGRTVATHGAGAVVGLKPPAGSAGAVTDDGGYYVTSTPITNAGVPLGDVTLALSLEHLREDVGAARRTALGMSALIFFLGILVVSWISTRVTRPLHALSDTVQRIAAGDLTRRAEVGGDPEVAEFARGFNQMVDSVSAAHAELARVNSELETRAEAQTAAARATSAVLESLTEVAPQPIIAVDLDWRVTRWNSAAERVFGWSASEVIGKELPYIRDGEQSDFRARQARVEAGVDIRTEEVVRLHKDGHPVHVLYSATVLRDAAGRPAGYIAVLTDVTQRRELEEQLRHSQKMDAVGRLAGGVAHDFNNILTVITSATGLLLESVKSEQDRRDLEQIAHAAERAAALTRQLLTFSRKQIVPSQPVDVSAVIGGMVPMLRRLLRANIELRTELDDNAGHVTTDPSHVEQMVMNLAVNASDAMPDGGTLRITTARIEVGPGQTDGHTGVGPGSYLVVTVSDTGIGMDGATASRIFEPFFTTKATGHGSGLGLAIVYALVTQLGGAVRVNSSPGEGAEFVIYLPHATETSVTPERRPRADSGGIRAESSKGRVLLVEDEEAVRRVVRRTLERVGFTVVEAADGERAIVAAATAPAFDILVTDLMMPGMNGREVAEMLTAAIPGLKVLFISGYADHTVDRTALTGANRAFLQKPFAGGELVEAVEELLGRGTAAAAGA